MPKKEKETTKKRNFYAGTYLCEVGSRTISHRQSNNRSLVLGFEFLISLDYAKRYFVE
jgi:hypothetical protein